MKKTHTRLANCSALPYPYPSASPAPLINNTPGLEYKKNLPQQTQSHFCSLQWDVQALWSLQRHIHEGGSDRLLEHLLFEWVRHNPCIIQMAGKRLSWSCPDRRLYSSHIRANIKALERMKVNGEVFSPIAFICG